MKLKTFTPTDIPSLRGSTKAPLIGVSVKSGVMRFNIVSVQLAKLKAGKQIVFHQDEERPEDWYLEAVTKDGFELRTMENLTPGGLVGQSAGMIKRIFDSVSFTGNSGHLQIGAEPVTLNKRTLWPLITAKLVNE